MSRPVHTPPSHRRSRLLALPLVLVCALAYLGSAAHFALVQHETCLEHGESVHAGEARVHPGAEPGAFEEGSFSDSRVAGTSQVPVASHGAEAHCAHLFLRREAPPPAEGPWVSAAVPPESGVARRVPFIPPEPLERLRLAPKSSPPSL